jgi:hypothetical protein
MHLQRALRGRLLPCGCLVGLYETYEAVTVAIIDAVDAGCADVRHRVGQVWEMSPATRGSTVGDFESRSDSPGTGRLVGRR